jgi:glycosyltransferase involved in cell wall biosynthesis
MRTKHKRVAFFAGYGWVRTSTPLQMTALFLANRGFQVDVFAPDDAACAGMNVGRLHETETTPGIRYWFYNRTGRAHPVTLPDGTSIPRNGWDAVHCAEVRGNVYDWLIGFDPDGLFCAAAYAGRHAVPYVYHSLEIEENTPHKFLESQCQRGALYTLTQDNARGDILARLNRVDRRTIFSLPNSSMGRILPEKDNYFRELFPEIGSRTIVLACGSLLVDTCIDGIVAAARTWLKEFVLVLNGWLPEPHLKVQVENSAQAGDNIFLSQHILPPAEKRRVFQSADICLIFFRPANLNLRYAAGSAGKYYDSLRCGLPLVGNDIPGMKTLLDEAGCGITVPGPEAVGAVLPVIAKYYDMYREHCLQLFPKYEFSKAYAAVLDMHSRKL